MSESSGGKPEVCPVLCAANLVSGKWTLLILRDLSEGLNRFSMLERSLTGISPKTLADRLKSLTEAGIITRTVYPEIPPRVEYAFASMGQELLPLIDHMRKYGTKWLTTDGEASGPMRSTASTKSTAISRLQGDRP